MPNLSTVPSLLCEIASQIQLSDYNQASGIMAAHDYSWKISFNERTGTTSIVIETIDENLQNALDVI